MQITILQELDKSCTVQKGAARRRLLGEQVAFNMHTMGTSFVGKVRDVWQMAEVQIGEGVVDKVEFQAQVSGHKATEKASRIQTASFRLAAPRQILS